MTDRLEAEAWSAGEAMCKGKARMSEGQAGKAFEALRARQGGDSGRLHRYRCPLCRSWHVGHRPSPYKLARLRRAAWRLRAALIDDGDLTRVLSEWSVSARRAAPAAGGGDEGGRSGGRD
jgi:hypothetical protein